MIQLRTADFIGVSSGRTTPLRGPKCRQVLRLQPDDGFLITREERYDRAALARCVRLATQNAYLTLQSHLAESEENDSKAPAAVGANDG